MLSRQFWLFDDVSAGIVGIHRSYFGSSDPGITPPTDHNSPVSQYCAPGSIAATGFVPIVDPVFKTKV